MILVEPLQKIEEVQTELYAKFFHGLSNATRFKITELLLDGEKSVGELVEAVGVSQGQVSNHLACLKWCGYVSSRQEGKYVLYRVTDERVRTIMQLAKGIVADNAAHISNCTRM
ncbi:ArsR family transcriptional regulator [Alicyclobacillus ferrooxydans]|uniref:ArsR family transcriptional regulator n=1 Tax=Alicyclobacillus ferrooxydans TaxID=471514 RepID=A0A0P9CM74_9BACL|nr:ArsR family transcriptional regulator [Alicyclobacillus ferrooxydans]